MTGRGPDSARLRRAVCVVVTNRKGQVLAVGRPDKPGQIGLPGGHVEAGETLISAVGREAAEEAGILLLGERPVYEHQDGGMSVTCYVARHAGHPMPAEGQPVGWVSPRTLCSSKHCPFAGFNRGLFASMRRQGYRI